MAIDFARHPAVGTALREITFFIDTIANPHTTTEPLHIESTERLMLMRWLRNRFWEDHQPFVDPETQRQDIEVLLLELKLHGKLNRVVFGELHSSAQVPVFDKGEAGPSIANISEVMRDVLLRPELANPSVELVLTAMASIGMPSVRSIEMAGPRVIWLAFLPPCRLNLYGHTFASLRRLCLYLCNTHLGAATSNVQYFADMLATLPSLESLEVRLAVTRRAIQPTRVEDSPVFPALMERTLPAIKVLMFHSVDMMFGTLLSFVHRHKVSRRLDTYRLLHELSVLPVCHAILNTA